MFQLIAGIADQIQKGRVDVILPNGRMLTFGGKLPGLHGVLRIHRWRVARRLIQSGGIGFAESYLAGDWDSPDVTALLQVMAENSDEVRKFFTGNPTVRFFQRVVQMFNRNSKKGSARNIHFHYDLGNEFYEKWLDPSMTYSSAKFENETQSLEDAQNAKYRQLAESLSLKPGDRVLEIGCGWGGFAEFAAKEYGCQVTGITISRAQLEYAQNRIKKAGLEDRVSLVYRDYRDINDTYDKIASIEMFEAVGEEYWPQFFATVEKALRPGGTAALQIISIADRDFETYRKGADFIRRYIFPGGMLPSPTVLEQRVQEAGLDVVQTNAFGLDYARTLSEWRDRFLAVWNDVEQLGFDERFKRMWVYYLCYCEAGFRAGNIDVSQVLIRKPQA